MCIAIYSLCMGSARDGRVFLSTQGECYLFLCLLCTRSVMHTSGVSLVPLGECLLCP